MTQHVLIPVALDHESLAARKIEQARRLLAPGGKITLLTVLENIPGFVQEFVTIDAENHLTTKVKKRLDDIATGADDITTAIASGKPGVKVVEYAKANGVDLIIIGSQSPGATDYLLGSTAARVARRAGCSVYILR